MATAVIFYLPSVAAFMGLIFTVAGLHEVDALLEIVASTLHLDVVLPDPVECATVHEN